MTPFQDPRVATVFDAYPAEVRRKLMKLRELIFEVAASTDNVGSLEETLKWGEPAYLTSASRTGSTVRIAWKRSKPNQYAMYFICTTNLVDTFRSLFPEDFKYEGNRAIVFEVGDTVPQDTLRFCVAAALTYRKMKTSAGPGRQGRSNVTRT
jgi:hypothetical protein